MSVPTVESLDSIYAFTSIGKQGERYNNLIETFKKTYGRAPEFIVRSPGRVNLIGEHIDYSDYGVLPMAIERDVVQAVATTSDHTKVRLANMNPKYPQREFDYEGEDEIVTIDASSLEWSNYFKCGYKGMLGSAKKIVPKGMDVLVNGTVPPGSGLSSSAAFVCSSALAVITANNLGLSKQELTEIAMVAERNVGVNSGGMDQAASVFSEKNYALHVEFMPKLKTAPVQLPGAASFVIAHTLVTADKFTSGPKNYNLRVVETKMGARILANALFGGKGHPSSGLDTYKKVMDAYFENIINNKDAEAQLTDMLALVDRHLTKTSGYTVKEMADAADMTESDVIDSYMTRFPVQADVFRLHQRAVHVLTEARRVYQFIKICEQERQQGSSDNNTNTVLTRLGDIMDASHDSCTKDFDCSCPELNQVCAIAKQNGAFGARLTGAGWGGAAVFLTTAENVPALIQAVKDEYYHRKFPELGQDQLNDAIFPTEPCSGATVFTGFDHS